MRQGEVKWFIYRFAVGKWNIEFENVCHSYPSTILDEKKYTTENEHLVLWEKYLSEHIHLLNVSKAKHANIILYKTHDI